MKNIKDKEFVIYSEKYVSLTGKTIGGCLSLESNVYGDDHDSEKHYEFSKEETESFKFTSSEEVSLGAYVISEVKNRLDLILIASGAEVTLAMKIKHELLKNFIEARIVSMPNINEFFRQSEEYQNQVLPKGYKRMVLEFSNDPTLYRLVKNEEDIINVNTFGKSGTKEDVLQEFELDIASIILKIKNNI